MSWRYPAEWEPHAACWIVWPCRLEIWDYYHEACQAYADVVNAIAQFEPVNLIVPRQFYSMAKRLCTTENVHFRDFPVDDSWSRDTLPIFLSNGQTLKAINWRFNAWGNKFDPYDQDALLRSAISHYLSIEVQASDMVLEGGSINTDGQGTLLTTKQCLLHDNRNPNMNQAEIEQQLMTHLQLKKIIWLDQGIDGDVDTDGHIDNVACFIRPQEVLIQSCSDFRDPNLQQFLANRDILANSNDSNGGSLLIHKVEQPSKKEYKGKRLPLSYINYYHANGAVIMPYFESKTTDDRAFQLFKDLFHGQEVLQVNALPIILGGGGIHCITMQQPQVGTDVKD